MLFYSLLLVVILGMFTSCNTLYNCYTTEVTHLQLLFASCHSKRCEI